MKLTIILDGQHGQKWIEKIFKYFVIFDWIQSATLGKAIELVINLMIDKAHFKNIENNN